MKLTGSLIKFANHDQALTTVAEGNLAAYICLTNITSFGRIIFSLNKISLMRIREELAPYNVPAVPCVIIEMKRREISVS